MDLQIVSRSKGIFGKRYRSYDLDGMPTIGVEPGEEFYIIFHNDTKNPIEILVTIDGFNIQNSEIVDLSTEIKLLEGQVSYRFGIPAESHIQLANWLTDNESFEFVTRGQNIGSSKTTYPFAIGVVSATVFSGPKFDLQEVLKVRYIGSLDLQQRLNKILSFGWDEGKFPRFVETVS